MEIVQGEKTKMKREWGGEKKKCESPQGDLKKEKERKILRTMTSCTHWNREQNKKKKKRERERKTKREKKKKR